MIYLCTATEAEAKAALHLGFRAPDSGRIREVMCGANRVKVVVTGIGPRAAGAAMQSAAADIDSDKPCAVMVAGTCGALSASVREGAIVTYAECFFAASASLERVTTDPKLTEHVARTLRQAGIESQSVCGITSPEVAATRREKSRQAATGANVVDMESFVILSAARQMDVPAVVLRVVSDGVDREFPDFSRAISPEGSVNRLAAAAIAVRAPLATARLMLAQRRALQRLSLALEAILGSRWPDAG